MFDRIIAGDERIAADIKFLRLNDVTAIVNAGVPRVQSFFSEDSRLSYCNVEVFDNSESNFSHVFLTQVYPFVCRMVEEKRNVLVHDKTGRSVTPAILVGYLMLRYKMDLLSSIQMLLPMDVKISDHLLGELLLIQDARGSVEESEKDDGSVGTPTMDEYEDIDEEQQRLQITERIKQRSLSGLCDEFDPYLVRECFWSHRIEFDIEDTRGFCDSLEALRAAIPTDVFVAFQSGTNFDRPSKSTLGKDLAVMVNDGIVDMDNAISVAEFFNVNDQFCARFLHVSKMRLLRYYHDNATHVDEYETELARKLTSLNLESGTQLTKMIEQVEKSIEPMDRGRVLILNSDHFAQPQIKCNLPEELSQFSLPPNDGDKRYLLQPHLGRVEIKYHVSDSVSYMLAMPTDVFCVLNCFNGLDDGQFLSREQVFDICAADRLDEILLVLTKSVPRSNDSALLIQTAEGLYGTNAKFSSKVKKLKID